MEWGLPLRPDSTQVPREGGKSILDLMEAVGHLHLWSFTSAESSGKILEQGEKAFLDARWDCFLNPSAHLQSLPFSPHCSHSVSVCCIFVVKYKIFSILFPGLKQQLRISLHCIWNKILTLGIFNPSHPRPYLLVQPNFSTHPLTTLCTITATGTQAHVHFPASEPHCSSSVQMLPPLYHLLWLPVDVTIARRMYFYYRNYYAVLHFCFFFLIHLFQWIELTWGQVLSLFLFIVTSTSSTDFGTKICLINSGWIAHAWKDGWLVFVYLFVFLPFLGPLPWHVEVPRLRV